MYKRLLTNHPLVNILFGVVMAMGILSYFSMPREQDPEINFNWVVVRTILPLTGTFDHRIVDGMQIGKLARGIKRGFRKPEWLDQVPEKELEDCIFSLH